MSLTGAVQADAVYAGDRVKLLSTNTTPGSVQFVPAGDTEDAIGTVKRLAKKTAFVVGDVIEVTCPNVQVQYHVAGATVTPGMQLELASGFTQELDSNKMLGINLDYAVRANLRTDFLVILATLGLYPEARLQGDRA